MLPEHVASCLALAVSGALHSFSESFADLNPGLGMLRVVSAYSPLLPSSAITPQEAQQRTALCRVSQTLPCRIPKIASTGVHPRCSAL